MANAFAFSRFGGLALVVSMVASVVLSQQPREDPYEVARNRLVDEAVVGGGIRDPRVIAAMRSTPRHEFLRAAERRNAYYDMALPIGDGQTISPPYVVAFMTEALDPQPTDRVLEIGTGSGYQASVLSPLVARVYTIEIVESLGRNAAQTIKRLGYDNIETRIGDGYLGWPEAAPFQKIIVTCSPEAIPTPLIDQLADGGKIVIPLGERFQQNLYRFTKSQGKLRREPLEATFFVPMTGQAEQRRERQIDEQTPRLQHTSFEETLGDSDDPRGWFYARQVAVSDKLGAADGQRAAVFKNREPGRPAHLMQAFGIDGRKFSKLRLEFHAKAVSIETGRNSRENARVIVEFYGARRAAVGSKSLPPFTGTFDWHRKQYTISVPQEARLAVVGLGMFGATGTLAIDDVRIAPIESRTTGPPE